MQQQVGEQVTGTAGTPPSRHGLVVGLLADALSARADGAAPLVLDCGGGSGTYAVPLASTGARVTVVDVSADALATLRRRAAEAGVADRVEAVQGDVETLGDLGVGAEFDLVLAHGVLESVDALEPAFAQIAAVVRPGGLLSVLVGNPAAAVLGRVLAGDLAGALDDLAALDAGASPSPAGLSPDSVRALCGAHGLAVEQVHGIGVFADLVPGAALDLPGGRDAFARLEAECATRRPFAEIAGRVHLLARRPG